MLGEWHCEVSRGVRVLALMGWPSALMVWCRGLNQERRCRWLLEREKGGEEEKEREEREGSMVARERKEKERRERGRKRGTFFIFCKIDLGCWNDPTTLNQIWIF